MLWLVQGVRAGRTSARSVCGGVPPAFRQCSPRLATLACLPSLSSLHTRDLWYPQRATPAPCVTLPNSAALMRRRSRACYRAGCRPRERCRVPSAGSCHRWRAGGWSDQLCASTDATGATAAKTGDVTASVMVEIGWIDLWFAAACRGTVPFGAIVSTFVSTPASSDALLCSFSAAVSLQELTVTVGPAQKLPPPVPEAGATSGTCVRALSVVASVCRRFETGTGTGRRVGA